MSSSLSFLDLSACAGGLASGLEAAGFTPELVLTSSELGAKTIRINRPTWDVKHQLPGEVDAEQHAGIDLISATVRDLPTGSDGEAANPLGEVLSVIEEIQPGAVLISVSPEMAAPRFALYRSRVVRQLEAYGLQAGWQQFDLSWFGIPQRRRVFVLVAGDPERFDGFAWPAQVAGDVSVGRYLYPQMAENGWAGALFWASRSSGIGPAILPDVDQDELNLGSTVTKAEWKLLAVDGYSIAEAAPAQGSALEQNPRLTMGMIASLQGFPRSWHFAGSPAAQLQQIAGDFPPLVALSIGRALAATLRASAVARPDFSADRTPASAPRAATA